MEDFHIDPNKGPHAAAGVSGKALHYLWRIVVWELAVRSGKDRAREELRRLLVSLEDVDEQLSEAQQERDLMRFAEEVMADLERLPVVVETEPTTGMYL